MEFIKKCTIGNVFVGIYFKKEKNRYVVTDGIECNEGTSEEDTEMIIEENRDLLMGEYETTRKDRAEEEMMDRICDLLNHYFDDGFVS